ncbi:MAG: hypothetical protein JWQ69_2557 [Pseudomonas sp.]|nr:hypothetical protein [Pseudomonas sp.]
MIENYGLIRERMSSYSYFPDAQFKVRTNASAETREVVQKVRQYWADKNIPNAEKLKGFDYDLSAVDFRKASFNELRKITNALIDMGIIDYATGSALDNAGCDYDKNGRQINMDKKVDVVEYLNGNAEYLIGYIAEGRDFAKDTLDGINTAIRVMLALQERAQSMKVDGSISIKA